MVKSKMRSEDRAARLLCRKLVMMKRSFLVLATISIITRFFIPAAEAVGEQGAAQATVSQQQAAPVEDERGIVALDQALRDLANPYTVMCVATHPDDAD
jgi:hypothetical protein